MAWSNGIVRTLKVIIYIKWGEGVELQLMKIGLWEQ